MQQPAGKTALLNEFQKACEEAMLENPTGFDMNMPDYIRDAFPIIGAVLPLWFKSRGWKVSMPHDGHYFTARKIGTNADQA